MKSDEDLTGAAVKWKVPGAGMRGRGGFVALIDENEDPWACTGGNFDNQEDHEAHMETCRERWDTVFGLEGETLEEARQALSEQRFLGAAYHVNDCELLDDRPAESS